MAASPRQAPSDQALQTEPALDDPVVSALREAEAQYRATSLLLHQKNEQTQRALDEARRRAELQRHASETLKTALRDMHRAASGGSVYDLILKTCLALTGATRGLYVIAPGSSAPMRVRAAVDVDDYPSAAPSSFIVSLSRAALEKEGVTVSNDLSTWPEQPEPGEHFRNCLAAPVVIRNDLGGVVIVADKPGGDFDADDGDLLLSVGAHAAVVLENEQLQREVQEAYLAIVTVLADTMAARSHQTPQYLETGARRARMVAERLGLSEHDQSIVFYAALLHDIGNIGVSDGVLNKPGPLIEAERELIRAHTQIGHDLIRQVPLLDAVAGIVRHHHERFDGGGYPDGLKGDAIPIAARIVAVVAAYGAMLAPRSYRPARASDHACEELQRGAGAEFDPAVVDAFLAVLRTSEAQTLSSIEDAGPLGLPGVASGREAASSAASVDAA